MFFQVPHPSNVDIIVLFAVDLKLSFRSNASFRSTESVQPQDVYALNQVHIIKENGLFIQIWKSL